DRLYLAARIPVLIIWGERDPIVPVQHARRAHETIAGSRLAIFDKVGHLPQLEAPAKFVAVLEQFIAETEPARFDVGEWRAQLQAAHEPRSGSID
ncbi:MAG: alpha/beta fold hydrolase, partial [Solirubrobacteraceae bacterium]